MSTANELKAKGNEAFAAGNYDEAIKLFTEAIEADPANHVLYSNRSASLSSLKKYDEALKDAEKTIEIKPDWPKGYSRKGAALFGLGKLTDAHETYEAGLRHDPNSALLKKGLSEVESAMDRQVGSGGLEDVGAKMADVFQGDVLAKIAANPKLSPFLADPEYVRKINDIKNNKGSMGSHYDDQRIITTLFTLMGMGDIFTQMSPGAGDADAPKARPVSTPPPQPEPESKEPEKMEVEETEEDREAAAKKAEAAEAKAKGNAAYKARSFDEALEHYSKAIEIDSTDITFWNNKAAVYFEMGKYDECIETCESAIEVGRENRSGYNHIAKALGRIGSAYSKKDDLDKAINYYNRSLSEHRSADILTKLRTLEKVRKTREEEEYRDEGKANEARERGNEFFKAGKYPEAQKEYSEAIKRNPNDPRAYSNRAACLTNLGALPDALKDCDACVSLDPTFIKGYIRKANALYVMREYAEAMDALDEARAQDKEKKNSGEIDRLEFKCYSAINEQNANTTPEEALKRAQENPKIASLLGNPVMQNILQQMQSDPRAAREHLKNPAVASNLRKLMAAGIVRMG
ncbi:Hsp90 cochaperone [Coemansia sp. RSA 1813]|nr:Hsp90 cochaperone [Coemansia sp. RSA 1646]KAJ1773232.1 Hsp90 cochaperone [Coemansia sp. RSA 1843]KAJ2092700.1 Hsp90 cochaperone [Coemansia sp. RSA 986]KAJ2217803.1 Hsp90 cochaperone [Coemansia sp. RSA 487]KAJ2572962.1 Hsp90 cochaperone [Coemansia sp. RSA 1813]